jgi:hypothetical protein
MWYGYGYYPYAFGYYPYYGYAPFVPFYGW